MANNDKLDWIYKGANSLVDREEYLLGRKVDKTLEQLNEEEKDKKFVLPTPKNHVEHECIPPSIRDFNKIVQAEQVDLSAKLQEDPLVAIKKREEEARRQFLQNPIQLKKLQDALKKKESQTHKHKKKKKKHNNLDEQIKEKLQKLGPNPLGIVAPKKEKQGVLDTILMHKFNMFKDQLSEDDLKDILNGHVTDTSDEDDTNENHKRSGSSDSGSDEEKLQYRKKSNISNDYYKRRRNSERNSNEGKKWKSNQQQRNRSSSHEEEARTRNRSPHRTRDSNQRREYRRNSKSETHVDNRTRERRYDEKYKRRSRSRSRDAARSNRNQSSDRRDVKNNRNSDKRKRSQSRSKDMAENQMQSTSKKQGNSETKPNQTLKLNDEKSNGGNSDDELDRKIMAQLKLLRGEAERKLHRPMYPEKPPDMTKHVDPCTSDDSSESDKLKKLQPLGRRTDKKYTNKESRRLTKPSTSSSSEDEDTKYNYSDSEDEKPQTFGLVTSDGKKITLKNDPHKIQVRPNKKADEPSKSGKKHVQKMTEEEKDRLRKEMMSDAKARDKEREEYVKRYREKEKHEQEMVSKRYDADLVHTELLKAAKHSSVEQRIKSNLNNIQRSSRHMDQNFSKR